MWLNAIIHGQISTAAAGCLQMSSEVMRLTKCQRLSLDLPRSHLNVEICLSNYYLYLFPGDQREANRQQLPREQNTINKFVHHQSKLLLHSSVQHAQLQLPGCF